MSQPDHDRLTPLELEAINSELIRMAKLDPANWRESQFGGRYYVGPDWANDGGIDWPEPSDG